MLQEVRLNPIYMNGRIENFSQNKTNQKTKNNQMEVLELKNT